MTPKYHSRVIIGGAPSTGSSLLRRILHRHPSIFSGEETHLFSKAELYQNWDKYKSRLFNKAYAGLRNAGWHNYTGVRLDELGWSHKELKSILESNDSFYSFVDELYSKAVNEKKANSWVEKTPSNAYCFKAFLTQFDGKVIHITRNPLDNIASMVNRGDNIYGAVCHCLMNNAYALRTMDHPAQLMIKYESLVTDPKQTLISVCSFLDLEFKDSMLLPSELDGKTTSKMKGWSYDETEGVGRASLGKFESLASKSQEKILAAIHQIRIKSSVIEKDKLSINNITALAAALDYSTPEASDKKLFLHSAKALDMAFRTHRWYPYHIFNYPIEF